MDEPLPTQNPNDTSLCKAMEDWSQEKRASFVGFLTAFQVHSFALSGVELPEDEVCEAFAKKLGVNLSKVPPEE